MFAHLLNYVTDDATNNQQHVSNVTDDVGITLLHLSPNVITLRSLLHLRPNVITLRSLLHLRAVITFRSSTRAPWVQLDGILNQD